jgi:hypothetical protein
VLLSLSLSVVRQTDFCQAIYFGQGCMLNYAFEDYQRCYGTTTYAILYLNFVICALKGVQVMWYFADKYYPSSLHEDQN